jgi:hypothetical protein
LFWDVIVPGRSLANVVTVVPYVSYFNASTSTGIFRSRRGKDHVGHRSPIQANFPLKKIAEAKLRVRAPDPERLPDGRKVGVFSSRLSALGQLSRVCGGRVILTDPARYLRSS